MIADSSSAPGRVAGLSTADLNVPRSKNGAGRGDLIESPPRPREFLCVFSKKNLYAVSPLTSSSRAPNLPTASVSSSCKSADDSLHERLSDAECCVHESRLCSVYSLVALCLCDSSRQVTAPSASLVRDGLTLHSRVDQGWRARPVFAYAGTSP